MWIFWKLTNHVILSVITKKKGRIGKTGKNSAGCHTAPAAANLQSVIRQEFGLPDTLEPVNILAIGYASGNPAGPERHARERISLNELVHYEKF